MTYAEYKASDKTCAKCGSVTREVWRLNGDQQPWAIYCLRETCQHQELIEPVVADKKETV